MAFKCKFCGFAVFWNTDQPHPRTGKPQLCDARDPDHSINRCSIKKMLDRQERHEKEAYEDFIASVRPETAKALLIPPQVMAQGSASTIAELDNQPSCHQTQNKIGGAKNKK